MKKSFLILAVAIMGTLVISSSYAQSLFFKGGTGPGIYTYMKLTPGDKSIHLDSGKWLVGYSKNNPCGDLVPLFEVDKSSDPTEHSGVDVLTSGDLLQVGNEYSRSPGWTCFRLDTVYKGKGYSTGNVQLQWDGKQYISANPRYGVVDYRK